MGNLNTTTFTSNTTTTSMGTYPCSPHGVYNCNCGSLGVVTQTSCPACGQLYYTNGYHICGGTGMSNLTQCSSCQQWYNPYSIGAHVCSSNTWTTTTPFTFNGTWTTPLPVFKEVKEITTDSELSFVLDNFTYANLKLPVKFSDCFLKIGDKWSPLYPLIFSAFMNDEKTISFHLIMNITDKVFEGDTVVLKSVTTEKIADNLTLLQLTERVNQYFAKDKE